MGKGEALQPGGDALAVAHHGEHALGRHVIDHIKVVIALLDDASLWISGSTIDDIFDLRRLLGGHANRTALPVVTQFPDGPVATLVIALQHIGAERDRRVVLECQGIARFFEDVLGHDPGGVPTHGKQCVEARIGFLQMEDDRLRIGILDAGDVNGERGAPGHARMVDLRLDRIDHIVTGEFDAIAPVDALAQLHGHLREIGIIGRRLHRQRILPGIRTTFGIDEPQRIGRQLLQAVEIGRTTAARCPDVEPVCILLRRALNDQRFIARNAGNEILRVGREGGERQ